MFSSCKGFQIVETKCLEVAWTCGPQILRKAYCYLQTGSHKSGNCVFETVLNKKGKILLSLDNRMFLGYNRKRNKWSMSNSLLWWTYHINQEIHVWDGLASSLANTFTIPPSPHISSKPSVHMCTGRVWGWYARNVSALLYVHLFDVKPGYRILIGVRL